MKDLEKIINNLIERIEVIESKINVLVEPKIKPAIINGSDNKVVRDKTKYMYNGVIYSKNRLVLAVVSDYVLQNPKIKFEELNMVFDKSLQGSLGVVRLFLEIKNHTDASKRFFTNDLISLYSGEKVVVCTQWGSFNIGRFLLRAESLNFTITKLQ